jgi:ABC-2 type transport system ATP-binding protein
VSTAALVVDHLSKRFGDRVAFDDVSFQVGYGEVFGFLGPNGAGKTTTVRTLGTLLAPTSGSATVAGIPLSAKTGAEIRARISVMPESPGLYLRLTAAENLRCFAGLYRLDDVRGRIDRALRAVNLADRADDLCRTLSKGLRQRVALARALLNDPAVIFLDEPTSGLDPVAAREVHELIASLRERGVTIFLTTHRLDEAERLCDRVAILNTTLRLVGRPGELREQLFTKTLDIRIRPPLEDPKQVFGTVPGVDGWDQAPSGYALAVADILSIGESQHSLEDVYLELIGKALAILIPTLGVAYTIFGIFLAAAALFAPADVAAAVFEGSHLLVQLVFTPLLAGWSIWVGIAISARATDVRVAQQLGMFASLPPLIIVALMTLNVIPPSTGLALGLAAALLVVDGLGWRAVAEMFDRERLVTGGRT